MQMRKKQFFFVTEIPCFTQKILHHLFLSLILSFFFLNTIIKKLYISTLNSKLITEIVEAYLQNKKIIAISTKIFSFRYYKKELILLNSLII